MFYSDEGRIFFRSKSDNIEGLILGLPQLNTSDIVNRYKYVFSYLSGKEINTELVLKINGFKSFLDKTAKYNLEGMKRSATIL